MGGQTKEPPNVTSTESRVLYTQGHNPASSEHDSTSMPETSYSQHTLNAQSSHHEKSPDRHHERSHKSHHDKSSSHHHDKSPSHHHDKSSSHHHDKSPSHHQNKSDNAKSISKSGDGNSENAPSGQQSPTTVVYVTDDKRGSQNRQSYDPETGTTVVYVQEEPQHRYSEGPPPPPGNYDPDAVNDVWISKFEDPTVRRKFIARTYVILTCMLLFFFGWCALCAYYEPAKDVLKEYMWHIFIPSLVIYISLLYVVCCCSDLLRSPPTNYIILVTLTIACTGVFVFLTLLYKPKLISLAMAFTLGLFLILTLLAFICPIDVTKWYTIVLFIMILALIIGLLFAICVPLGYLDAVMCAIASVMVVVLSVFIVIDTQMLMSNKKYSLEPDMEVFAAIMLFMDLVMLFYYILMIMGFVDG